MRLKGILYRKLKQRNKQENEDKFSNIDIDVAGRIIDFFNFRTMITPILIKWLYGLGTLLITIIGAMLIMQNNYFYWGLVAIFLGNLVWRLICEYTILMFRIHETLVSIERKKG
jgi:hypothetical protein